jgi:hypothetical protein
MKSRLTLLRGDCAENAGSFARARQLGSRIESGRSLTRRQVTGEMPTRWPPPDFAESVWEAQCDLEYVDEPARCARLIVAG